ncbi:MAG: hypothetical protein ACRDO1_18015 [Nocardioidaceae bacterium]
MTTIIGQDEVAVMSSRRENFAMMIESAEYAQMQTHLFEVLWATSSTTPFSVTPSQAPADRTPFASTKALVGLR